MIKKAAIIGAAVCLISSATFADTFTVTNKNIAETIHLQCNGVPGFPIGKGASEGPFHFWFLKPFFQSQTPECTFYTDKHPFSAPIGKAILKMSDDLQTAVVQLEFVDTADGFQATFDPASVATPTPTPAGDITVTLSSTSTK
jgi:hypothetical protein